MVLHTINTMLLRDTTETQRAQLEHFKSELEALANRWDVAGRERADAVLNAALNAAEEVMNTQLRRATDAFREQLGNQNARLVGGGQGALAAKPVVDRNVAAIVGSVMAAVIGLQALALLLHR
jgi:hypothetical protein